VLETITVTEVFPLNCGGVAAGEPQPVLPPRPSNDIRVIRKESDNAEGAEDQSAISNPASPDFANSKLRFPKQHNCRWNSVKLSINSSKSVNLALAILCSGSKVEEFKSVNYVDPYDTHFKIAMK
jgi:hypothetical protein